MKKVILFSLLGAVSLFILIFSIIMLATVSGENLFYTSVDFGSFCAKGYRWAILGLAIVTVTWLILGIKVIVPAIKRNVENRKKAAAVQNALPAQPVYQLTEVSGAANTQLNESAMPDISNPKFCPFCGGKLKMNSEFCSQCGKKIPRSIQ